MDFISFFLLAFSILLSVGRNVFSKKISAIPFGTKNFYVQQTTIFISGGLVLYLLNPGALKEVSSLTILYALLYGILLLLAQWCYTVSLNGGNVGVCSTIYSFGFILPSLSGILFFHEQFSVFNIIGILVVIVAIILAGKKRSQPKGDTKGNHYIIPLLCAMCASGGLGIMQKAQQASPYPAQRGAFVLLAFLIAGAFSFVISVFAKQGKKTSFDKKILTASGVGIAFAGSNLLNTTLAGRLPGFLFFPLLNIGTILFSMLVGAFFLKEKITKAEVSVFVLGIIAILLLAIA